MLTRTTHWSTQEFHQFLLSREKSPFEYGRNDCALFSADAIKSFTGVDIAEDFRTKYKTQTGALKAIKKVTGGESVEDVANYVANKYSLKEYEHCLCAKRGDLVLVDNGGTLIFAVVHLSGRHVISVSETGLVRLPLTSIKRSWGI